MAAIILKIISVLISAHLTSSKPYYVNDNSLEVEKLSLLKNPDIDTIIPGKKNIELDPVLVNLLRNLPHIIRKEKRDEYGVIKDFVIHKDKEKKDRNGAIKNFDGKINIDHLQHNENSVVINNPPKLMKTNDFRFMKRDNVYGRHDFDSHSTSDSHDSDDSNDQEESLTEPFIDLTRIEAKDNEKRHKKEPNPFGNLVKTNDIIDTDDRILSPRSDVIDSFKTFLDPSKFRAIQIELPPDYMLRRNAVKEKDLQHILRGGSRVSDESGSVTTSEEDNRNTKEESSVSEAEDNLKRFKMKKAFSESDSDESKDTPKTFKLTKETFPESGLDESTEKPKRFKVKKNKSKSKQTKPNKSKNVSKQKWQPVFESEEAESIEFQQPVISTETRGFNDSGELSTEEPPKKRKKKNVYHTKEEIYIQSPRRLVKVGPDFKDLRKRLQHFLPKRYHWHEDEFQNLGYFWFNGPQGRDPPGPWRITY